MKKNRHLFIDHTPVTAIQFGIDIVRAKVFYPSKHFNRETTKLCEILGEEIEDIVIIEWKATSADKVTHHYIDELDVTLSMNNTITEHLKPLIGMKANYDDSKRMLELFNDTVSIMEHGDIHKAAGQAKCQGNNNHRKEVECF